MDEIVIFWHSLKNKASITFRDLEELEKLLGRASSKMSDLRKSRDKWKEKYKVLKDGEKRRLAGKIKED